MQANCIIITLSVSGMLWNAHVYIEIMPNKCTQITVTRYVPYRNIADHGGPSLRVGRGGGGGGRSTSSTRGGGGGQILTT